MQAPGESFLPILPCQVAGSKLRNGEDLSAVKGEHPRSDRVELPPPAGETRPEERCIEFGRLFTFGGRISDAEGMPLPRR